MNGNKRAIAIVGHAVGPSSRSPASDSPTKRACRPIAICHVDCDEISFEPPAFVTGDSLARLCDLRFRRRLRQSRISRYTARRKRDDNCRGKTRRLLCSHCEAGRRDDHLPRNGRFIPFGGGELAMVSRTSFAAPRRFTVHVTARWTLRVLTLRVYARACRKIGIAREGASSGMPTRMRGCPLPAKRGVMSYDGWAAISWLPRASPRPFFRPCKTQHVLARDDAGARWNENYRDWFRYVQAVAERVVREISRFQDVTFLDSVLIHPRERVKSRITIVGDCVLLSARSRTRSRSSSSVRCCCYGIARVVYFHAFPRRCNLWSTSGLIYSFGPRIGRRALIFIGTYRLPEMPGTEKISWLAIAPREPSPLSHVDSERTPVAPQRE